MTQAPAELLEEYLQEAWAGGQPPARVERIAADDTVEHLADVYERSATLTAVVDGWRPVQWTERRLVVRSLAEARTKEAALRARLTRAQEALSALTVARRGTRRWLSAAALEQAAAAVLAAHHVVGLLRVEVTTQTHTRVVRAYGTRPARTEDRHTWTLRVTVDAEAWEAAVQRLGWRVYATNQPAALLSAEQAVLAYREEYLVEHGFGRLKGRPLSLSPLYLERDDHVTGLIRLRERGPARAHPRGVPGPPGLGPESGHAAGPLCRSAHAGHRPPHRRAAAGRLQGDHPDRAGHAPADPASSAASHWSPAADPCLAGSASRRVSPPDL